MNTLKRLLLLCPLLAAHPAKAADTPSASNIDSPDAVRRTSLHEASTLDGATGLVRLRSAGSGAVGTFRLSLAGNLYSGRGFLCPDCENAQGQISKQADDA